MKTSRFLGISLLLVLVLAAGQAAAQGDREQKAAAGPVTIKIFRANPGSAYLKSMDEMMVLKEVEKKFNVDLQYLHPTDERAELNIVIASGDYPDVFEENDWTAYAGGIQKAYLDGIIIKLNDVIAKRAPNITRLLNQDARYRKETLNDGGEILGVKRYDPDFIKRPYNGFILRKDWLDKVGLKTPTTIEDWHRTLKAFKERDLNGNGKPVKYPFVGDNTNNIKKFSLAWGVLPDGFSLDPANGKVVFSPTHLAYRAFLEEMSTWAKEGLFNPEHLLTDSKIFESEITSGRSGAMWMYNSRFVTWMGAGQKNIPGYLLVAAPYPVGPAGKPYAAVNYDLVTQTFYNSLSSKNKNVDKTMEVMDYYFSAEGSDLLNWGIEGVTYKVENGERKFLIPFTEKGKWIFMDWGNPRLMDVSASFAPYTEHQVAQTKVWFAASDYGLFLPTSYTLTDAEAKRMAALMSDINTLTRETVDKILLGALPVSAWDAYVATAKKMGIEEAVKIVQTAVDRFSKRR